MKINGLKTCLFSDLKTGDCFLYSETNRMYMKIPACKSKDKLLIEAVSLNEGYLAMIPHNTRVYPVEVEASVI